MNFNFLFQNLIFDPRQLISFIQNLIESLNVGKDPLQKAAYSRPKGRGFESSLRTSFLYTSHLGQSMFTYYWADRLALPTFSGPVIFENGPILS